MQTSLGEDMPTGGKHERPLFRILRPDENIKHLRAKDSSKREFENEEEAQKSIQEHIKSGSSGFRSPWISTTAELNVALAFSGVFSRVAVIEYSKLRDVKKDYEIVCLDKDYLREKLTGEDAKRRSERSDEVLVFKDIRGSTELDKTIVDVERYLHPDFNEQDDTFFPIITKSSEIRSKEMIAGPNKRLFRLSIDGKNWLARLPRPNYDLKSKVLFGEDLVRLCKHQFATMCSYRTLGAAVPRCAMYIFKVSVKPWMSEPYPSAMILMEDLEQCVKREAKEVKKVAQMMLPVDLLLGNWDPLEGASNADEMISPSKGAFFVRKDRSVVRLSVDRALGCVYPEDREKPEKVIVEFEEDNVGVLKETLLGDSYNKQCFGKMNDDKNFIQMTMDMTRDYNNLRKLKNILALSPGLPWKEEKTEDLWKTTESRIQQLLQMLPYYEIVPVNLEIVPPARDGHKAVAVGTTENDKHKKMLILGGNSKDGPLNDFWEFDFHTEEWKKLADLPYVGRYSFSMHLFKERYVIVFGGCSDGIERQGKSKVNCDLLWFDIVANQWHKHKYKNGEKFPAPRGRHGSCFRTNDGVGEMTIVGGCGKDRKKRDDVWKLTVEENKTGSLMFRWEEERRTSSPTQRSFIFTHQDSYYLLGGFGRNLRNLEEISRGRSVVTRTSSLPASESESFHGSKSLAGFGAVYDEIDGRVILIGGGNVNSNNNNNNGANVNGENRESSPKRTNVDKGFGKIPATAEVSSKSRILILAHEKGEWKWSKRAKYRAYSSLDDSYKLPNLLHWTMVYMDHSVVLFGGRQGDEYWSNKMYKLELRPKFKSDVQQSKLKIHVLREHLKNMCRKYEGKEKDELISQLLEEWNKELEKDL